MLVIGGAFLNNQSAWAYRDRFNHELELAQVDEPRQGRLEPALTETTGELTTESEVLESGRFYNKHVFVGQSGQIVRIELASEAFDAYLRLEDSTGTQIAENDDGLSGTTAEIVIQLPENGEYRVLATTHDEAAQGAYRLTVMPASTEALEQAELLAKGKDFLSQGNEQYAASQYNQALASWLEAVESFRQLEYRKGAAAALGNIAVAYTVLGNYQQAIAYYAQQLTLTRELGDRRGESNALSNSGAAYNRLGNYLKAIENYEHSLTINRERGDREGESFVLGNLGLVYADLGDYPQAIRYHKQNLEIARELESPVGEATALLNLGIAYNGAGDYEQAITSIEEALASARSTGDQQVETTALVNLGNTYSNLNQNEQAIAAYEQSLSLARLLGDRLRETAALDGLGSTYTRLADYERALDYHEQSLALARETGFLGGEAIAFSNAGFAYLQAGQLAEAELSLYEAISKLEQLRDSELSDGNKITLLETQLDAYKGLEQSLILQNKPEAALEITERGRARAFVDLLSRRLSSQPREQLSPEPPDFSAMQAIAKAQQSVLVEYSLLEAGPDSSFLYIWVIQPTGEMAFRKVSLESNTSQLTELVSQSRRTIGGRNRGGLAPAGSGPEAESEQFRQLYQLLIEPIADLLPDDPEQPVTFIPQGTLFLVPFAALTDEADRYLIEKHTILTAPSIQVLSLTHQQKASLDTSNPSQLDSVLAVGNPMMPDIWNAAAEAFQPLANLPGAAQEAQAVAAFFGTEGLFGAQATEETVKQRMSSARIIHLATHGLLEYGNPSDSGTLDVPGAIALAPTPEEDGLLTSVEILELNLQADLVVLSACDTGLGTITGDGVIGLSRSLIAAGVPSVVVSLWSIPDAPTADLMTEFYSQMQQGQNKAQALRQAMLITMESHPNPGDWAAFTLIGEGN